MDEQQRVLHIFQTHREVHQAFIQVMAKVAQRHGLTPLQLIVLRVLNETPGLMLSGLSDKLNLGNSTTSGIIDRMVRDGLISRERTEEDRRAVRLTMTDKAVALWSETDATRARLLRPLLGLSEEDRREYLRIQNAILGMLKQAREDVHHD